MTDSESSSQHRDASQRPDVPSQEDTPNEFESRHGSLESQDGTHSNDSTSNDSTDETPEPTPRDAGQNAPPTPSRPGTGRSHVHSERPPDDTDSPASDVEHEVFILTPEVMRRWAWTGARWISFTVGSYYLLCTLLIISYRWVDPPTTGVQLQRSIAAWWDGDESYETTYQPVPLALIDDDLELAVVAAEDTRFFQHTGIDWKAISEAIEDNRERGFVYRGGSTITQQLAKNLFQTTHSSFLRKGLEVPLTYLVEIFLSKERILELYLNVIEWGPGVFGVEAAVQHHYGRSAEVLSRYRAAALAACVPNPLVRTPGRMGRYTRTILGRMYQLERIEPRFAK